MAPHEAGYRAYLLFGLTARNPFEREERKAAGWQRGYDKARNESREGSAALSPESEG